MLENLNSTSAVLGHAQQPSNLELIQLNLTFNEDAPSLNCCSKVLDKNVLVKVDNTISTNEIAVEIISSQNKNNDKLPDNLSLSDKLIDFFTSTKMLAGLYGTPAGILLINQLQTATCWRCYVFRVLPTAGLCAAGFFSTLIMSKFAEPISKFIKNTAKHFIKID
jgi:hypothetical protein